MRSLRINGSTRCFNHHLCTKSYLELVTAVNSAYLAVCQLQRKHLSFVFSLQGNLVHTVVMPARLYTSASALVLIGT
jgi:hypothetical protein